METLNRTKMPGAPAGRLLQKALHTGGTAHALSVAGSAVGSLLLVLLVMALVMMNIFLAGDGAKGEYLPLRKEVKVFQNPDQAVFSTRELADLAAQPGVLEVVPVGSADYGIYASLDLPGRSLGTMLFFESLPEAHLDRPISWDPSRPDAEVPILIGEGFLYLYNGTFAPANGMPVLNEAMLAMVPIRLDLSGPGGQLRLRGRIAGTTSRMDSILVPESFLAWSNERLAGRTNQGVGKVLARMSSRAQPGFREWCRERSFAAVESAFSGSAVVGLAMGIAAAGLVLAVLVLLLALGQFWNGLLLAALQGRETWTALMVWGYRVETLRRLKKAMVLRPFKMIGFFNTAVAFLVGALAIGQFGTAHWPALVAGSLAAWAGPAAASVLADRVLSGFRPEWELRA